MKKIDYKLAKTNGLIGWFYRKRELLLLMETCNLLIEKVNELSDQNDALLRIIEPVKKKIPFRTAGWGKYIENDKLLVPDSERFRVTGNGYMIGFIYGDGLLYADEHLDQVLRRIGAKKSTSYTLEHSEVIRMARLSRLGVREWCGAISATFNVRYSIVTNSKVNFHR